MVLDDMKREKWIDNAKGIAIILVILAHVNAAWGFAYGFHLVVFFLLSGYTFKKADNIKDFAVKKFSRLMIPYFYTCGAIIIMDIINSYLINKDDSIVTITGILSKDLMRSFFASGSITNFGTIELGTRIGAIWFLPALFFAIVLFQFLRQYCKNDLSLGLASVGSLLLSFITAPFIWMPFSVQSGMLAVPFIFFGHYVKKKEIISKIKNWYYVIALGVLLTGIKVGLCYIGFVRGTMADLILSPIVGLSGCLLVYLVSKYYKGHFFEYVGRISLTVLCTHLFSLETMGVYFNKLLDIVGIRGTLRSVSLCIIYIVFAIVTAAIIEWLKSKRLFGIQVTERDSNRNPAVDIAKGICIIAMVIGHYQIEGTMRSIIFSCHMMMFVFLSGYCYNANRSMGESVRRMISTFFRPYVIAVIVVILLSYKDWSALFFKDTLIKYSMGISFSKQIFTGIQSVGPISFILLLFIVRLLYLVIDKSFKSEYLKWAAILAVSLAGVLCGKTGYWLPWSIDVACYSIIFYKAGVFAKENGLMRMICSNNYLYIVLAPIWVFMIYAGSMEVAVRNYGGYGLVIAGCLAGISVIYMMSKYIEDNLRRLSGFLILCGKSSIYILIIHTIFSGRITAFLSQHIDVASATNMAIGVLMQICISIALFWMVQLIKSRGNIKKTGVIDKSK